MIRLSAQNGKRLAAYRFANIGAALYTGLFPRPVSQIEHVQRECVDFRIANKTHDRRAVAFVTNGISTVDGAYELTVRFVFLWSIFFFALRSDDERPKTA